MGVRGGCGVLRGGMVISEVIHLDCVILPPRTSKIDSLASFPLELKLQEPSLLLLVPPTSNDRALAKDHLPQWGPWYNEKVDSTNPLTSRFQVPSALPLVPPSSSQVAKGTQLYPYRSEVNVVSPNSFGWEPITAICYRDA